MSSDENLTYIIGSESFMWDQRLIQEVEKTPLLWDKTDMNYNSRPTKEREWERIGALLKKNKRIVRQKWKTLREYFLKEMKKVNIPFGKPLKPYIQYYRGKWTHFEAMLFLRETLQRRTEICHSPDPDIDIQEDDMVKKEPITFEDDVLTDQVTNSSSSDNYEKEPSNTRVADQNAISRLCHQPIKIEILDDEDVCIDKGVKRPAENNNAPPVPAKMIRPSEADVSSNTSKIGGTHQVNGEIDDDLHFAKSLVPYLRKLNPIRKLLVRNEIQNILLKEGLCENCKFGNGSSPQS